MSTLFRHAFLFALLIAIRPSFPASKWTWGNPLPQGNTLTAITWSGKQFAAVGWLGVVVTSPDGEAWTVQNTGVTSRLNAIAWTGSAFVAVGDSSTVLTSPDGTLWTRRNPGAKARFTGVAWDGVNIVVAGNSDTAALTIILTSPDAIRWTRLDMKDFGGSPWSVARLNGQTVLLGSLTSLAYSPDSNSWSSWGAEYIRAMAWSGSRYYGVGGIYGYATSTDGKLWSRGSLSSDNGLVAVTWDGQRAIAVGHRGAIRTSLDGVEWTYRNQKDLETYFKAIASNGKRTVAVGEEGIILVTSDGINWDHKDATLSPARLHAVASGGGYTVAVGDSGVLLTSRNGSDWVRPQLEPSPPYSSMQFSSVAYSGKGFAVTGWKNDSTWCLTSRDAMTWDSFKSAQTSYIDDIHWTGSLFVGRNPSSGSIWTSIDGSDWTERFKSPGFGPFDFASNGKQVIALGAKAVALSLDGISWNLHEMADSMSVSDLVWADGRYVAVSPYGPAWTSADGIKWTRAELPWKSISLLGVAWTGKEVVAVGYGSDGGVVATSPDGIDWKTLDWVSERPLTAVTWTGSRLIVVGDGGAILASDLEAAPVRRAGRIGAGRVLPATMVGGKIRISGLEPKKGIPYEIIMIGINGRNATP